MNADTYLKARLAHFALTEGVSAGDVDPMLAIAFVLRNRVDAGWFGGDWMRVLDTFASANQTPPQRSVFRLEQTIVRLLLNQMDDLYSGDTADTLTDGALHYADLTLPIAPWFRTQVLGDPTHHPRCATVLPFAFFR